jgi:tetratricopeptide (TPR) repeat protein
MPPSTSSSSPAVPFAGQVVVFTGKLSLLGRKDAQALVERLGGEAADEVTVRTTMLVLGPERVPQDEDGEKTRKLRRAEQVNGRQPGQVRIVTEDDFCALAGVPSPQTLRQQFYSARDICAMYPALREDQLRYLDNLGLIHTVLRTNAERYYGFTDLLVVKQAAAELEEATPFRVVVRSLLAAREGQLAFDFRSGRSQAHPAKVLTLRPQTSSSPDVSRVTRGRPLLTDPQAALARRYFAEASSLDDGAEERQEEAAAAYRKALVIDPDLVPAIVNLANLHYAHDELIEAQALYERAIGLEPECFEAHFNLANIHHDLGRYDDALRCYRSAVSLNPTYADAHFYLAVTLEKSGRSQEAKPHWRLYQQLAPDGEWVELAKEFSE